MAGAVPDIGRETLFRPAIRTFSRHPSLSAAASGELRVVSSHDATSGGSGCCAIDSVAMSPSLLAVSHGTSDPDGAAAIELLVRRVAERLSDVDVRAAFVDVQQPDPETALAEMDGPTVVIPLLLSRGFHVRVDLGRAVRDRRGVVATTPLGPDPRLAEVLAARIADVPHDASAPVILAIAGSRDPASLDDAEQMTALLGAQLGRTVIPAFLAAREPRLDAVRAQHPDAAVATYLLGRGFFFDVARRLAGPALLCDPLLDGTVANPTEPPTALVDLIASRYLEGVALLESELVRAV